MIKTNPNLELSTYWHYRVDANPKECWINAVNVLMMSDNEWRYCEGWAAQPEIGFIVMDHGWVETADGTIIDPTWAKGLSPNTIYCQSDGWSRDELFDQVNPETTLPLVLSSADRRQHHTQITYREIEDYAAELRGRAALASLFVDPDQKPQPYEQAVDSLTHVHPGTAKAKRRIAKVKPAIKAPKQKRVRKSRPPAPPRPPKPEPVYPVYTDQELVIVTYMKDNYKAKVLGPSPAVKGSYSLRRLLDDRVDTVHPKFMRKLGPHKNAD